MAIKIMTDGSTDIPQQIIEDLDIQIIPIHVQIGEKDYVVNENITSDELYEQLSSSKEELITTTQPTPQEFEDAFNEAAATKYNGIICIVMSSKLSKVGENARSVAKKLSLPCPIEVIDSKTLSSGTALIVIEAARMAKKGKTFEEIVEKVNEMTGKVSLSIIYPDLEQLNKSGRLGKVAVFSKTILGVTPVIEMENGELTPVAQVRTRRKAIDKLYEIIKNTSDIEEMFVTYNTRPEEAYAFVNGITTVDHRIITLNRLGPALSFYCGTGLLAVAIRTK
jgi:DegV family protein with EDD domain